MIETLEIFEMLRMLETSKRIIGMLGMVLMGWMVGMVN